MNNFIDVFKNLGMAKSATILGIFGAVVGFVFYFTFTASAPSMGVLYSGLDPSEAGKIVERLRSTGVPLEAQADTLLVPVDQIAELRMQLAADGIGGSMGYEIFDKADLLGTSSALLDINHVRAIEGEIAKSIRTISNVQGARVHLVVPKKELFSKDVTPPSASIILKMKGAQRLTANQIQAVQALVASAVPNLTNDKISIIDDKGTLLSRGKESTGDVFSNQSTLKAENEEKLGRQIELLLEKTLGPNRVRAEVSTEMDFDRVTMQAVDYNPEGQVVKSLTTSEEGSNSNESNPEATTVQNAIPNQEGKDKGGSKTDTKKTEENTAYEISNKTTTTVKEAGSIKRLSVAVLVDGSYAKSEKGDSTYTPRTDEELKKLTELVKTAVGFKEDRGDSVKVINMKFSTPDDILSDEPNFMQSVLKSLNIRKLIELSIAGLFSIIVLFGFIKPMLTRLMNVRPMESVTPTGELIYADSAESFKRGEEQNELEAPEQTPIQKAANLAQSSPDKTANILKSWLYEEGAK